MVVSYDPFSPTVRTDPYPYYRELRDSAPVHRIDGLGAYAISRYDDVAFVLGRADLFSSDAMQTMFIAGADPRDGAGAAERLSAVARALPFRLKEMAAARNLISTDPPQHEVMRRVVSRGFTPRRIAMLEGRVAAVVAECVDRCRRQPRFDLMHELAIPVPTIVIAEMLGVERARQDDFKRWSDWIISQSSGSRRGEPMSATGYAEVLRELSLYLVSVIDERRRNPTDDLISTLIEAQEGSGALTPMEVVIFVILLLVAGNETTTNLIGNAVNALLDHPEQLERVIERRELLPSLVDETIRFDGPIQFVFRRATQDVTIADTRLSAGSIVMPILGSANRDERQFANPDVFDIRRDASGHIGFGHGVHFCLGASLARLEAKLALDALLDDLPRLRRRQASVEYVDSFLIRGPGRLDLEWTS